MIATKIPSRRPPHQPHMPLTPYHPQLVNLITTTTIQVIFRNSHLSMPQLHPLTPNTNLQVHPWHLLVQVLLVSAPILTEAKAVNTTITTKCTHMTSNLSICRTGILMV